MFYKACCGLILEFNYNALKLKTLRVKAIRLINCPTDVIKVKNLRRRVRYDVEFVSRKM